MSWPKQHEPEILLPSGPGWVRVVAYIGAAAVGGPSLTYLLEGNPLENKFAMAVFVLLSPIASHVLYILWNRPNEVPHLVQKKGTTSAGLDSQCKPSPVRMRKPKAPGKNPFEKLYSLMKNRLEWWKPKEKSAPNEDRVLFRWALTVLALPIVIRVTGHLLQLLPEPIGLFGDELVGWKKYLIWVAMLTFLIIRYDVIQKRKYRPDMVLLSRREYSTDERDKFLSENEDVRPTPASPPQKSPPP